MKKKICLLLTGILVSTSTLSTYGAYFSDINNVPWAGAVPYIQKVADNGLMVGSNVNGQTVFRAKEAVTLCETAQLIYSLLKETGNLKNTNGIVEKWSSVMKGYNIPTWAYTGVAYCLENSIIAAGDVVAFMSGNTSMGAKREQVAYMLGRALQTVDGSLTGDLSQSFADSGEISAAALPYVNMLYQQGIVSGNNNGNFKPRMEINRAEMAVLMSNSYDLIERINIQRQIPERTTASYSTTPNEQIGSKTVTVYEVQNNGDNIMVVVNDTDGGRTGYLGDASMSVSYSNGGYGWLYQVKAGDTVSITYDNSRLVRCEIYGSKSDTDEKETKRSGDIAQVSTRKIRLSGGSYLDIHKDIVVRIDGKNNKDLDDLIEAVDDGDDMYANLSLNSNNEVVKIIAKTIDDDDDDDSDGERDGIISTISSSRISLSRSKNYDLADENDLSISVSDGENRIKDLDDLITAVKEDDKDIDVTIELDDDEVTSIRGEVIGVEGELKKVHVNSDKIVIICESDDEYTYRCEGDVSIKIDGDTVDDLDELYDLLRKNTIDVTLTLDDDMVTKITGETD